MKTIGLDVHKRSTTAVVLDEATGELSAGRKMSTDAVVQFVCSEPGPVRVVMETGSQSFILAREMMSCQVDVAVVDCAKAHQALKLLHRAKTDRLDAEGLACAHARRWLEEARVWVMDEPTKQLRGVSRTRIRLVRHRVGLGNQVHALLDLVGMRCPSKTLTTVAAQEFLEAARRDLPGPLAKALGALLDAWRLIGEQAEHLGADMAPMMAEIEECRLLQTVPGIGEVLAGAIFAEIGSIERFESAEALVGYCGLDPEVSESGEHQGGGELTRRGNPWLRWALVLAAHHFPCKATEGLSLRKWYYRLVMSGKHVSTARCALARRLAHVIYAMLRDGTEFDPTRLAA